MISGGGVLKSKYLLYHLSIRYRNILCTILDSYFILMFIYTDVLWFLMYSKSIHGNKLNFIEWLQYLHIFINEKIADNNSYHINSASYTFHCDISHIFRKTNSIFWQNNIFLLLSNVTKTKWYSLMMLNRLWKNA